MTCAIYSNCRDLVRKHIPRKSLFLITCLALIFYGHMNFISRTELVSDNVLVKGSAPLGDEGSNGEQNLKTLNIQFHLQERNSSVLPTRKKMKAANSYQDLVANLSSDWTKEQSDRQRQIFKERSSLSRTTCKSVDKIPGYFEIKRNRLMNNLRWVKKHDLVWCPIFKSASTTWVKNLLLLAGEKVLNKSFHGRVRELYPRPEDPEEQEEVLESSMKLIIVRHPLDRLLSAYRDKMLRVKNGCDPYVRIQKDIIENYKDPNEEALPKSSVSLTLNRNGTHCLNQVLGLHLPMPYRAGEPHDKPQPINMTFTHPTFSQFLFKVKDDLARFWKNKGNAGLNLHWRPYWVTCGPCKLEYDVIAHVETLGPDQEYIIRELGLQNVLYNSHAHVSNFDSYKGTSQATEHYFSQVPRNLLMDIVSYYKPDFEIFGYDPEPFLSLAKA